MLGHSQPNNLNPQELFKQAFEDADALAGRTGNILKIVKAYEKALEYTRQISDFEKHNEEDISREYLSCLEELISYYDQIINDQLPCDALKILEKRSECQLALSAFNKTEHKVEPDYKTKMKIAAKQWGFVCQNIPLDGNCLFHAIAHQIQLYNLRVPTHYKIELHQFLRKLAAQHIQTNADYYQEKLHNITVEQYVRRLSESNEWGDNLEITALVRELNITLVLIQDDRKIHVFKTNNSNPVLYLGYIKDFHFVSLTKTNSIQNTYLFETIKAASLIEVDSLRLQKDSQIVAPMPSKPGAISLLGIFKFLKPKAASKKVEAITTPEHR